MCIMLECFVNFLDDPYYEPLPWFMILVMNSITFKIPILTATYVTAVKIGILNVIEFITSIFILFK